jgi:hypothetical protein
VRRAAAALAVVLAVAAGCSGGGGVSITAEAFAQQGNAQCQKLANDDAAGRAALGTSPSADAMTSYVQGTYVPEANETYKAIAALPKPKDTAADIDALLTDVLAEIRIIQSDPVAGGNRVNQAELVNRLRSVGLTACGAGFAATVDKASFVIRANAFCTNLQSQVGRQLDVLNAEKTVTTEQKADFVTTTVVPLYRETINLIEAIGYPPDDATFLASIVKDARAYIESLVAHPELFYVRATDPATLNVWQRWREYGATSCG